MCGSNFYGSDVTSICQGCLFILGPLHILDSLIDDIMTRDNHLILSEKKYASLNTSAKMPIRLNWPSHLIATLKRLVQFKILNSRPFSSKILRQKL